MTGLNSNNSQLEDMVDLENFTFSIDVATAIADDLNTRIKYENKFKDNLYSNLLLSLTHESFSEDEASVIWNAITKHRMQLNNKIGRDMGISIATLDYLTNIKDTLSDVIIIEDEKSVFVTDSITRDELTGLYLREVLNLFLDKEIHKSKRKGTTFSFLMIDVDDFKEVNDVYGHQKGDEVLEKIGAAINSSIREMFLAARFGGEEFSVLMPDVDCSEALHVAKRILKNIATLDFKEFSTTVSIGLSQTDSNICTSEKLIESADNALYEAKKMGKNRIAISESFNINNDQS